MIFFSSLVSDYVHPPLLPQHLQSVQQKNSLCLIKLCVSFVYLSLLKYFFILFFWDRFFLGMNTRFIVFLVLFLVIFFSFLLILSSLYLRFGNIVNNWILMALLLLLYQILLILLNMRNINNYMLVTKLRKPI